MATITDLPVPYTTDDHMSQPAAVKPKGCAALGF